MWTLLLLGCSLSHPDPLELALERPLSDRERAEVGDVRTFLVIDDDQLIAGSRGRDLVDERDVWHGRDTLTFISLDAGRIDDFDLRGQLVSTLYETLLVRAENLKDDAQFHTVPKFAHHGPFRGELVAFVKPGTPDPTMKSVTFTAEQAQFTRVKRLALGTP